MQPDGNAFYSPGRVKLLLWGYDDLVRLVGGSASPETPTQHLPRETPEGGFESGAAVKADLDRALTMLEPILRRVVWDYYVAGYAAVEIAAMVPGCNRWFVDRARHRGIRQMALSLHWKPRPVTPGGESAFDIDDETSPTEVGVRERMRMVVSRAFAICPKHGPPGFSCPVLDCRSRFDEDGKHVNDPFAEQSEAA